MNETKPIFTSKIFVSSVVGIIASVAMHFMREYGIDYAISAQVQLHVTTVVMGFIAYWRTRPTKKLARSYSAARLADGKAEGAREVELLEAEMRGMTSSITEIGIRERHKVMTDEEKSRQKIMNASFLSEAKKQNRYEYDKLSDTGGDK